MATSKQITDFINTLGKLAVNTSKARILEGKGYVLPSICIAQAAIETGWGTSSLMTEANAYFGIKANDSWTGKVYSSYTNEVYDGVTSTIYDTFRAYDSLADSVADYYNLICSLSRYRDAVSVPGSVKTPAATIQAIKDGGYATAPNYVSSVLSIVNTYSLVEWDKLINYEASTYKNNIVAIATAEIGAAEPTGDDKYIKYYNELTGMNFGMDVAWCAIFVTWCARHANIPTSLIPNFASVSWGISYCTSAGTFKARGEYTPVKGDIIFFDGHVGIVTSVDAEYVYTIEGNSSDQVIERKYNLWDGWIIGYCNYEDAYAEYVYGGQYSEGDGFTGIYLTGTAPWKQAELNMISSKAATNEPLATLVSLA